jgi:hypothetical protein
MSPSDGSGERAALKVRTLGHAILALDRDGGDPMLLPDPGEHGCLVETDPAGAARS